MPKVVPSYKAEARARIAEVAQRLFETNGYRRTTMDDVAEALGVSKGALYLYYPSKVHLLREIQTGNRRLARRWMDNALAEDVDPAARFADTFDEAFDHDFGRQQIALYFEILGEASHDPEIRRAIRDDHQGDLRSLRRFLGELRRRGRIAPGVDLDLLVFEVVALFQGAVWDLSVGLDPARIRRTLRAAVRHVLAPPAPGPNPKRRA